MRPVAELAGTVGLVITEGGELAGRVKYLGQPQVNRLTSCSNLFRGFWGAPSSLAGADGGAVTN